VPIDSGSEDHNVEDTGPSPFFCEVETNGRCSSASPDDDLTVYDGPNPEKSHSPDVELRDSRLPDVSRSASEHETADVVWIARQTSRDSPPTEFVEDEPEPPTESSSGVLAVSSHENTGREHW